MVTIAHNGLGWVITPHSSDELNLNIADEGWGSFQGQGGKEGSCMGLGVRGLLCNAGALRPDPPA